MSDERISDYIDSQRERGKSDNEIRQSLLKAGWDVNDVDSSLFRKPETSTAKLGALGPVDKLKLLFFSPTAFFRSVADEKNYFPILLFFAVTAIILSVVQSVFSIIAAIKYGAIMLAISFGVTVFTLIVTAVFVWIAPFIGAGITHLGILIVGGKNGYFNTFKPVTYSSIIGLFYALLNSIVSTTYALMMPAITVPTATYQTIPAFSIMGISIVIGIIGFIHTLYVEVTGISMFHNMSKGRALVGALLIPLIIVAAVIGLVFVAFASYFGVLNPNGTIPEKCVFPTMLTCQDYQITPTSISLTLMNGAGKDMTINSISAYGEAVIGGCINDAPIQMSAGSSKIVTIPCSLDPAKITSKKKYTINAVYVLSDGTVTHSLTGELFAKGG
jgi:hypothetical protein